MSQSKTSGTRAPQAHFWKPCALLIDNKVIGGSGLGLETYIATTIQIHRNVDATSYLGFSIDIPFGSANEDDGFGICHTAKRLPPPAESYRLIVKFPTKPAATATQLDNGLRKLVPPTDKKLCKLEVRLRDYPVVKGFGMPFANSGHQSQGFINDDRCIMGDITLMQMIKRLEFDFIVAAPDEILHMNFNQEMPAPFRYPYGEEHFWSEERYDEMLPKTKGPQFNPAWSFDNDNEHLAALTQSQVQDVIWIHKASQVIAKAKFRAYFINPQDCSPVDCNQFYVLVPLGKEFMIQHENAWRMLTKSGFLKLRLFNNEEDEDEIPAKWDARIQEAAKGLDIMELHLTDTSDLILQVRRPSQIARRPDFEVQVFADRRAANIALRKGKDNWTGVSLEFDDLLKDYKRKVDAVNLFHPDAQPSNPVACGIPKKVVEAAKVTRPPIPEDVKFKMALHRDLLRGNGFWDTLVRGTVNTNDEGEKVLSKFRERSVNGVEVDKPWVQVQIRHCLPCINLISFPQEHLAALFDEVLPEDRHRFMRYLSERPLGLGVIMGGPGFGKTTALAVGTLGMAATLGKVYATAPTNAATDNLAERLNQISQRVTARHNEGKLAGDNTRARCTFILRGYKPDEEYEAFVNVLKGRSGDEARPNGMWSIDSKWNLHLSPSFWLLMVLRSPAVRELSEDDPLAVYEMQAKMDIRGNCASLRAVATGVITWQEYESQKVEDGEIFAMFDHLLSNADIVCTTPAVSYQRPFKGWKEESAKGIAVDEAGNISRPDLYSVWGNTLLPCLLSGDDRQLPPTVMTLDNKGIEGDYMHLNRLGQDAKISALEFIRASGWPTYRLRTQLRMANGLFDTCHREVYSDLPFTYGPGSSIDIANHSVGQALEKYLTTRFPGLTPSRPGALQEVFVHCVGTTCDVDEVTKSKSNLEQVNHALDFLNDLIKRSNISASNIAIITPYQANVELVERRREKHSAALFDMPPAATVDSFQGCEADIIVAILGTTKDVGPGFTTDSHRLNVMLSRHKSGLLVFGDINVAGQVSGRSKARTAAKGNAKGAVKGKENFTVFVGGAKHFVKHGMLSNVLRGWYDSGRVVELRGPTLQGRTQMAGPYK
ncbi:hypothetical protein ACHAQJ_008969 [Trichoderma viride]